MKIYLVDDNMYGQMSMNYGYDVIEFLKGEREFIEHIEELKEDNSTKILSGDCLLIHDSLPDKEKKERIVAKMKQQNKKVVIFSGQFARTTFDENKPDDIITGIKKDRFYHNLPSFLKSIKEGNVIQLNRLALGERYEIKKTKIIRDRLTKLGFAERSSFDYEKLIYINESEEKKSDAYKDWEELYFFAYPNASESDFKDFDESCFETLKDYEKFIEQLNVLVKKILI